MPTIRDVVQTLGDRDGVEAVIVLGRDGLPIDTHVQGGMDSERLAALVPGLVTAAERLGAAADRGGLGMGVVEYDGGMALVAPIGEEALLAVVFASDANIGRYLFDLRQHREAIAALL